MPTACWFGIETNARIGKCGDPNHRSNEGTLRPVPCRIACGFAPIAIYRAPLDKQVGGSVRTGWSLCRHEKMRIVRLAWSDSSTRAYLEEWHQNPLPCRSVGSHGIEHANFGMHSKRDVVQVGSLSSFLLFRYRFHLSFLPLLQLRRRGWCVRHHIFFLVPSFLLG